MAAQGGEPGRNWAQEVGREEGESGRETTHAIFVKGQKQMSYHPHTIIAIYGDIDCLGGKGNNSY